MKKLIIILSLTIPFTSFAQGSKQFNPKAGLSVIGGIQFNKHFDASAPVYGLEFSMECPLDQGKKNHIRQKLSVIRQEGKEYKSLNVEINPQYKLTGTSSFELGIGPVAGMIFTKMRDNNKPVFTYGAGAGAVYYFKKIFIGIETRYGMTKKMAFDKIKNESGFVEINNLNHLRTFIKLGYNL
jgi:hypothetical protein